MTLDPRLNAFREDLADKKLRGQISASRYVTPQQAVVISPTIDLRSTADVQKSITSQLLFGQHVDVFEKSANWAWVQSRDDRYVGYVKVAHLEICELPNATHVVCVPSTFIYPQAELKLPILQTLSMGSQIEIIDETELRGTRYALLRDGTAIIARHLREVTRFQTDYVQTCVELLNVPYLWGGGSAFGLDCSGLVQLAMREAGIYVPRDSDMQAKKIGVEIDAGNQYENLRRGDLVFWVGHVAIVRGSVHGKKTIIHANGNTMNVASEGLAAAIERIAYLYGKPICYRRPDHLT